LAAAMTFAGLMNVFNRDFRGDMADNYELFGAELPVWLCARDRRPAR